MDFQTTQITCHGNFPDTRVKRCNLSFTLDWISGPLPIKGDTSVTKYSHVSPQEQSLREKSQKEHISLKNVETRTPLEGEIVLVNEPKFPRGVWELAKIKEIKKGKNEESALPTRQYSGSLSGFNDPTAQMTIRRSKD
ncbi:hypothetical protein DINM_021183 [Dirofilaria immitis]|nr:hypothetical protein [Dirofilaria immitis]